MEIINEYKTKDLCEAAVLKYFSHKLECVDRTQRRVEFYFIEKEETVELLKSYYQRTLQVEPYAFFQCLKELKDRLYNG